MKVACIGEAMIELSMVGGENDADARVNVAGDTLNTAVYLKRGAPELQIDYVTRLGVDAFSGRIRDFIAAQGVGTGVIETSQDKFPGLYAISLDAEGERSFSYWRSAAAARDMFSTDAGPDFAALLDYDVLYFSAISLAILPGDMRQAFIDWLPAYKRETGGRIAFDSNYRPRLWESAEQAQLDIAAVWKITDIGLPSVDDEMDLFEDLSEDAAMARLKGYGLSEGALKCGSGGPRSLGGDNVEQTYSPAPKVVDSTAAGDSFNGGYLSAYLRGGSQAEALLAGHNCARDVVQHKGAIIPLA